jgi:hypothetical protein
LGELGGEGQNHAAPAVDADAVDGVVAQDVTDLHSGRPTLRQLNLTTPRHLLYVPACDDTGDTGDTTDSTSTRINEPALTDRPVGRDQCANPPASAKYPAKIMDREPATAVVAVSIDIDR